MTCSFQKPVEPAIELATLAGVLAGSGLPNRRKVSTPQRC